MGIFSSLFGRRGNNGANENQQAVLVYLDGQHLPKDVYETCDTSTIEDQLIEVIESQSLGDFDGNEFGPTETILFMYGPDAERLFAGIEPTLRAYPLCQNARVVIRKGGEGAQEREVRLPRFQQVQDLHRADMEVVSDNHGDTVEDLFDAGMKTAVRLLEENGAFFPFAVTLTMSQGIALTEAHDGNEAFSLAERINSLRARLAQQASSEDLRATAIVSEVILTHPSKREKRNAVSVEMECIGMDPGITLIAYCIQDGKFTNEGHMLRAGQNFIFKKELPTFVRDGEIHLPRWIQVPFGLFFAAVTLLCGVGAASLTIMPPEENPGVSIGFGIVGLLACVWVLGLCGRLITGKKNHGGIFAPKALRGISWIVLLMPAAGIFTGYWSTHPVRSLFQAVAYLIMFFGLRAMATSREGDMITVSLRDCNKEGREAV